MAYKTRFRFRFRSTVNGNDYRIDISQDGYAGVTLDRCVGGAPVLRRDNNERIGGTSLEFLAECNSNEEYAVLYTSDPHEFKAELYANGSLIWQGYVSTELYAEPDIAPPYDVTITCTDGLGELKNVTFVGGNTSSLEATISGLLTSTGLSLSLQKVSSISAVRAQLDFLSSAIYDSRHLTGKTSYEVLQIILRSLNMRITQVAGAWLLYRESDIRASSLRTVEMGSLASAPWWVVGQLTNEVRPARKAIPVSCPAHYRDNALGAINGWIPSGVASWSASGYWSLSRSASILSRLSMDGAKFRQLLTISARTASGTAAQKIKVQVKLTTSSTSYNPSTTLFLAEGTSAEPSTRRQNGRRVSQTAGFTWTSSVSYIERTLDAPSEGTDSDAQTFELTLPFAEGARSNYPGTVEVTIIADSSNAAQVAIHDVTLTRESELAGFRDILRLDNGARGDLDEVEVDFIPRVTDVQSGGIYSEVGYRSAEALQFMHGALRDSSGNLLINFRTAQLESMDYLSLISRDYALGCALPRLVKSGVVNVPYVPYAFIPVRAMSASMEYLLETWRWDLYNDELSFEMVSLPAASITVESESVEVSVPTQATGRTSHGSSTGGVTPGGSITAADVVNALGYTPVNPSDFHSESWNDAADKAHTHSNTSTLDGIGELQVRHWNTAYFNNHTHGNKDILDSITQTLINAWNGTVSTSHTHGNKQLLDSLTSEDIISNLYIAGYGSTSYLNVEDALHGGKVIACDYNGMLVPLTGIDSDDNFHFKGFLRDGLIEITLTTTTWSQQQGDIPSGDSNVFIADFGVTTYDAVDAAMKNHKAVMCQYQDGYYPLTRVSNTVLSFGGISPGIAGEGGATYGVSISVAADGWVVERKDLMPEVAFVELGHADYVEIEGLVNYGKKVFLHDGGTDIAALTDNTILGGKAVFVFCGFNREGNIVRHTVDNDDNWNSEIFSGRNIVVDYGATSFDFIVASIQNGYDVAVRRSVSENHKYYYHLAEWDNQVVSFYGIDANHNARVCSVDVNNDWDVY